MATLEALRAEINGGPPAPEPTQDEPDLTLDGGETGDVDNGAESGEDEGTVEETGEATGAEQEPGKVDETSPGVKRALSLAKNRAKAAEERAAKLQEQFDAVVSQLPKPEEAKPAEAKPEPQPDAYDDPAEYRAALAKHYREEGEAKGRAEAEQQIRRQQQEASARRVLDTFAERKAAFEADHPDYAEVAESDEVTITNAMAAAILEDEVGPAIAYHLGQNPDEAKRIAGLSPMGQAAAIGRLAARLAEPEAKPPAPKPRPITPIGARSSGGVRDPAKMSMDEYAQGRVPPLR